MLSARPKPLLIIFSLLVVLALISTVSIVTSRSGFGRPTGANGANFQRPNGAGGAGAGNAQGAAGGGNFQGNGGAAGGNFAGRGGGGFNTFTVFRSIGLGGQSMLYVTLGFSILGILLTALSAFGVWKQKAWGLNLGMLMAILFLIGAVPVFFSVGGRNFNLLRYVSPTLTVLAALPILVFGILPSTRDLLPAK